MRAGRILEPERRAQQEQAAGEQGRSQAAAPPITEWPDTSLAHHADQTGWVGGRRLSGESRSHRPEKPAISRRVKPYGLVVRVSADPNERTGRRVRSRRPVLATAALVASGYRSQYSFGRVRSRGAISSIVHASKRRPFAMT